MEEESWGLVCFPRLPDNINAWIHPEPGIDAYPTSALQHVCCYDGFPNARAIFEAIMSDPDLDVNYESQSLDGTEKWGTTAFVYLLLSIYDVEEDDDIIEQKFEMLKELVARDDFNINKPVAAGEFGEPDVYYTPLSWFFEVAFSHHVNYVCSVQTTVEVIAAIVAHPRIAPTAKEIAKCAEYGIVVLPRPIRNLNKWRKACRCLIIYQFWWKVAGEGQHAPGGRGEKRSLEEFEKDFA